MMDMEQVCFELICHVGDARSSFIQAIQEAKKGKFDEAKALITSGQEAFNRGHGVHAKLIHAEAEGSNSLVSLLLVHAEDQLMSAETFKILCQEFIEIYQRLNK